MKEILTTSRLLLREMCMDDLDFMAKMLADPEVMRHYPQCYNREEATHWVQRQLDRYQHHGIGLWLAIEKDTKRPVGQVGLVRHKIDGRNETEVGYLIHRPHWRTGLATEAGRAVRDYAFETIDLPHLLCLVRPVNFRSQGVARKLGMYPIKKTVHAGYEHIVFFTTREHWSNLPGGD